jgi:hypothetical protein
MPVGGDAIVAAAHEAARHYMKQETAQELSGGKHHLLGAAVVGVVAVREAHHAVADEEDTAVRDGHAVGVPAEVFEHRCGSGEGALAVHHPVGAGEGVKEFGPLDGIG